MPKDPDLITVCVGSDTYINDVHVGYLEGGVKINRDAELLKFLTGVPRKNVKQIVLDDQFKMTMKLAQFTNKNLAIASLNMPYTEVAGGGGTMTALVRTFVKIPGQALEILYLPNPGTEYAVTAIVENVVDSPDTYDEETDIMVDEESGVVYRNPLGNIPSLGSVKITGTYTKRAYSELALGKPAAVTFNKFRLNWVTDTLREFDLVIHRAQSAASWELDIGGEGWNTIPLILEATDDSSNNPDTPYGRIREIEPA